MSTLADLPKYSDIMANASLGDAEVEVAKEMIRGIMEEIPVETHLRMCVDLMATLHERNREYYFSLLMATLSQIAVYGG
jgi:hypothetical protein